MGATKTVAQGAMLARLNTCPWLAGLPPHALTELAGRAQWRHCTVRQALYRSGEQPEAVFGVHKGSFKVVTGDLEGRELVETVLPTGSWFGEIFLFSERRYFSDCLAMEASTVLVLAKADVVEYGERWPSVYRLLLTGVARKTLAAIWMSAQYRRASPELRLAHRLEIALQLNPPAAVQEWVELRERLSHELISQMLGLSRPRVTQAVQALTRAGVMVAERGRVRVHVDRLASYCAAGEAGAAAERTD